MRWPRPFYFLGRALRNLVAAPLPALLTSVTIGVALFLFGALLVTGLNLRRALVGWAGATEHMTIYLEQSPEADQVIELQRRVASMSGVEKVRLIPAEEGFLELRDALGEGAGVLEGVEASEVLPPVLSVSLNRSALDGDVLRGVVSRVRRLPGVESVESDRMWLDRYSRIATLARWVAVGWGLLLACGALLVIGNSTRLAAFTRKQEIEVLRLVGASDAFVLAPFFLEGAIQGVLGSVFGLLALGVGWLAVQHLLSDPLLAMPLLGDLSFLDWPTVFALAASGPVLGALGSGRAARRFLQGVPF